ncbi:hypothetical protein GCM10027444_19040 [Actinopolyspora lacussalsi]
MFRRPFEHWKGIDDGITAEAGNEEGGPFENGFVFGEGTGSATPLAWSMTQFVQLANNMDAGRNLETPDVVARRYTD